MDSTIFMLILLYLSKFNSIKSSTVHSPAKGLWKMIKSVPWGQRNGHQMIVFHDQLYIFGGNNATEIVSSEEQATFYNDIWTSTNGENWTRVEISKGPIWQPRSGHAVIVYNDSIWLIGGSNNSHIYGDVWHSTDCRTWNLISENAFPDGIVNHQLANLENQLLVIGGQHKQPINDVWYTKNGLIWSKQMDKYDNLTSRSYKWSPRYGHSVVTYDEKLIVMGGFGGHNQFFNDVWMSLNQGISWIKMTENAPWCRRSNFQSVVDLKTIYLFGGNCNGEFQNDVWKSLNHGVSWEQEPTSDWSPRQSHTVQLFQPLTNTFKNRFFILCGGMIQNKEMKSNWKFINTNEIWTVSIFKLYNQNSILYTSVLSIIIFLMLSILLVFIIKLCMERRQRSMSSMAYLKSKMYEFSNLIPASPKLKHDKNDEEFSNIKINPTTNVIEKEIQKEIGTERQTLSIPITYHTINFNEIEIDKIVGNGSFGEVYKGSWRGMLVAIKSIQASKSEILQECDMMARVSNHRHIVQFIGTTISPTLGVCIVSKFMEGGSLDHLYYQKRKRVEIEPKNELKDSLEDPNSDLSKDYQRLTDLTSSHMNENKVYAELTELEIMLEPPIDSMWGERKGGTFDLITIIRMVMEAAAGIAHLHDEGIIHRDLACRNILIDRYSCIGVGDFGFARLKDATRQHGYTSVGIGAIKWEAPECWGRTKIYSEKTDVFSFGVCLYEILSGCPPWEELGDMEAAHYVLKGERMKVPKDTDRVLRIIMEDCWNNDPLLRPTMKAIHGVLERYLAFVKKHEMKKLKIDEWIDYMHAMSSAFISTDVYFKNHMNLNDYINPSL